jgi:hypothetical protein
MTEWQKIIAPMVAESVKSVIAEERAKLTAQVVNKGLNVMPPQNSVDT